MFSAPQWMKMSCDISEDFDSTTVIDMIINDWGVKIFPLFVRRSARATKYEEAADSILYAILCGEISRQNGRGWGCETEVPPLAFKHYAVETDFQRLGHPATKCGSSSLGVQYAQKLRSSSLRICGQLSRQQLVMILSAFIISGYSNTQLSSMYRFWKWLELANYFAFDWHSTAKSTTLFKRDLIQYTMEVRASIG